MKYITPTLSTERLKLKRGSLEDYEKVYEYDFTKLRDINGEFEFIEQDKTKIKGFDIYADETDEVFDWIVYLKDNDVPVANIIANREDKDMRSIELSFNMHPSYWKQGYMTEAIIEILEFLFENGFDNVICGYSEGNIKSKNIGVKLGFEPFGTIEKAWEKQGVPITDYKTIMSKERFNSLYKNIENRQK